ncbi:hypothetical protein [Acanthopleuribacter pedis]|uniref:Uncharacterized protein n=1 Tax=Acanthopleuribacter pedis TaxID=442870 RepID=A0A8J7QA62_9BACT|nr:hypothetical protein [Acanthopleuribacter pedis]MBO1320652.1 hypothetical protein [Acanthopleuribacter pedis]
MKKMMMLPPAIVVLVGIWLGMTKLREADGPGIDLVVIGQGLPGAEVGNALAREHGLTSGVILNDQVLRGTGTGVAWLHLDPHGKLQGQGTLNTGRERAAWTRVLDHAPQDSLLVMYTLSPSKPPEPPATWIPRAPGAWAQIARKDARTWTPVREDHAKTGPAELATRVAITLPGETEEQAEATPAADQKSTTY